MGQDLTVLAHGVVHPIGGPHQVLPKRKSNVNFYRMSSDPLPGFRGEEVGEKGKGLDV